MIRVLMGSRPVVGSSHRMTSGSVAMARASPTRFFMPPERSAGCMSSMPGRFTSSSVRATRSAAPSVHLREVLAQRVGDVLAHGQRVEQRRALEHHRHLPAHVEKLRSE